MLKMNKKAIETEELMTLIAWIVFIIMIGAALILILKNVGVLK